MTTPPARVRTARPEEYDDIGRLTASTYLAEGWADEDYAQVLRDVAGRAGTTHVLVALNGARRLVGTVTVATRGGPVAETAGPGEAVMRMLVVDPAARGAGAGRALVAASLEAARADGCRLMRLSTQEAMSAARRVYTSFGFARTPARDWSPVPGLDLLAYELVL